MAKKTVEERFWLKVNKNGQIHSKYGRCWEWTGSRFRTGYGRFCVIGECRAHRVAYRLLVKDVLDSLFVLHKCDNPLCVRPSHLFLGTSQDNMDDMVVKNRQNPACGDRNGSRIYPENLARGDRHGRHTRPEMTARGEKVGTSVLTEIDVKLIRRRYARGTATFDQLGKAFNVSKSQISNILHRRCWNHVQ